MRATGGPLFNDNTIMFRRADQSKFRREIQCAGLRLLEEPVIAGLDENYTMIFGVGTPVNVIL